MGSHELSDRSRRLLATLVREYIETGEPVSSQVLARRERPRRVVGDRPEHARPARGGRLRPPAAHLRRPGADRPRLSRVRRHAARRPQARATRPWTSSISSAQQAGRSPLMDDLLASVSHVVSRAARPRGLRDGAKACAVLQRIEFVPLGGTRVLVVVVARGNQVTQKVVDAGEELQPGRPRPRGELPEHRVRRPAAARGARGGARAAATGARRSTISCWPARCGWRSPRSRSIPGSRRSTSKARRRCSSAPAQRAGVAGHAARAARDDGREGADGAPAEPLHRRPRADRRHRRRARRAGSAPVQPDRLDRRGRHDARARSA